MRTILSAACCLIALSSPATAATIHVPGDQPTIQAAIAAAGAGDSIVIAAGTYSESIQGGSMLTVQDFWPLTIIGVGDVFLDAQGGGRVLNVWSAELRIENLRFLNGSTSETGGGICARLGYLSIEDCVIESCTADDGGGIGTVGDGGSVTLSRCILVENSATHGGGLAVGLYWDIDMHGCTFVRNVAAQGGGIYAPFDESLVYAGSSMFWGDQAGVGGWIWSTLGASLVGCTFVGDPAQATSGGFYHVDYPGQYEFERCIITGCGQTAWYLSDYGEPDFAVSCTDIFGNAGGDWVGDWASHYGINANISADPLFCNPSAGDFTLDASSPCAPAQSGCGLLIGALPVDCGATSVPELPPGTVQESSLSAVKSLY